MELKRYLIFAVLLISLFTFSGCGEDKTIYETDTNTGGTTQKSFTFTSQTDVAPSSTVTSNSITVSGVTGAVPISVTGGSYSIGDAEFTTTAGTVSTGQSVRVRHTASALNGTTTTTTLTIGNVSGTFKSTTSGGSGVLDGEAQYKKSCGTSTCHGVPTRIPAAFRNVTAFKNYGMTFGLDDTQLQKIADYLATQP
ncbi:cytochrome c [Trichlorobacter lovleyi]|jgi:hypothetical protein|uniref:Cytochrome c domain-containing protein n=1 Tax=Trichlorobacter lovleyi (strain ATCC BAA-1151 / DSM 17278 / SZ) TaxID=398767 RepID=B3E7N8_TRIL1|nr:cytochrome c [Trichlorobacter lovleyi]ACD95020.1 hypothetical protein Glov_1299 [Trichlorobacter lovleyi SZ]